MSDLQISVATGVTLNTTKDVSEQDSEPTEFARFEKLTRDLVGVPKPELDEQREKS